MPRKAGDIVIRISAGTAELVVGLEKAEGKVGNFGKSLRNAGAHGVSSMQAASGAIRELEGNFAHNIRAVERFLVTTLKLGPVITSLFPLVGAIAFAGLIERMGEELYDFFKEIQRAPEKIKGSFRELQAPLKLVNDELRVSSDRLQNEISKLQGHQQNTLALALDEGRVAADKLAMSLDKDLAALNRLMKEQEVGFMRRLMGEARTKDLRLEMGGETGFGGFAGRIAAITDAGEEKIGGAKTLGAQRDARAELDRLLRKAYADEIRLIDGVIAESEKLEAARKKALSIGPVLPKGQAGMVPGGAFTAVPVTGSDQTVRLEEARRMRRVLSEQSKFVGAQSTNTDLTEQAERLRAATAYAKILEPYQHMIDTLAVEARAASEEIKAAGLDEYGRLVAKAYAEAAREIERVNKEMDSKVPGSRLSAIQEEEIMARRRDVVESQNRRDYITKENAAARATDDRITSINMLTAAIGKGYDAAKKASVETQLLSQFGEKYSKTAFQPEISRARSALGAEFEAKHQQEIAQTIDHLNHQIELEYKLADAQQRGAFAVQQVEFAERQREAAVKGASAEQLSKNVLEFAAKRKTEIAAEITQLNDQIQTTKELTAARFAGSEGAHRAAVDAERRKMALEGKSQPVIDDSIALMELKHRQEISNSAADSLRLYANQLEQLKLQDAALQKIVVTEENRAAHERAIRENHNAQLRVLAQEALAARTAEAGVRAFFLDMQADAKSSGMILYEAMHSALDRTSTEFAKLFTGQKTDFRRLFGEIGQNIIGESIKSSMQGALGAIGKKLFGVDFGAKRGDTPTMPMYVSVVNGLAGGGGMLPGLIGVGSGASEEGGGGPGSIFGGSAGRMIWNLLSGFLSHRAEGGMVSAGSAYIVGEHGPELLTGASGRIVSAAALSRGGSHSGNSHFYQIDARGTDPVQTEMRVRNAIMSAHNSAVGTSLLVQQDHLRRSPTRF